MKRFLVAVVATLVAAGCGSDEAQVVKGAFEQEISSAQVELVFTSREDGGAERRFSLTGPYKSNGEGKLPSVDMKFEMAGTAKSFPAQILTSADNAFVVYEGETYEVGKAEVAKFRAKGDAGKLDLRQLMGTMQDWFPESDPPADATLDGEPVTRVTGKLDLTEMLKDLNGMSEQPGMKSLKAVDKEELKELAKMVSDPRFTVDVGRDDGKLRRVVAAAHVDNTDKGRSGDLEFLIRFKAIDEPVTIDAPASGRPIKELGDRFLQDAGVQDTAGDSGPDSDLRYIVRDTYENALSAIDAWKEDMAEFESDGDAERASENTRKLALVMTHVHDFVEDTAAETADGKRERKAVLAAAADMRDAATRMSEELLESKDDGGLDKASDDLVKAAERYDEAVAEIL